ncbi:MAG: hypothetical protein IJJ69_09280 [Oscillospiraceae bacterium]|nr:hypothetical protein [Oscillospiraceae bacterium]
MNQENISIKESLKIFCKEMFKFLLILALIIFIGAVLLVLLFLWSMSGTTYRKFNQKRTAEMEKIFGITVTDEVQLYQYYTDVCFDENTCLDIIVLDYKKFIRQNLPDTISDFKTYDDMSNVKAGFEYITNEDYTVSAIVYQFPEENNYYISLSIEYYSG